MVVGEKKVQMYQFLFFQVQTGFLTYMQSMFSPGTGLVIFLSSTSKDGVSGFCTFGKLVQVTFIGLTILKKKLSFVLWLYLLTRLRKPEFAV